jgi:hypothetical protein
MYGRPIAAEHAITRCGGDGAIEALLRPPEERS